MEYYYSAYSLTIRSEILCALAQLDTVNNVDIDIKLALVPDCLPQGNTNRFCQIFENRLLIKIAAAKFLLINGNTIIVQLKNPNSNAVLPSFILGALLLQRKLLALHANAVVYKDKAILIMGESGAGKSTLTLALLQLHCTLLTDDLSVIAGENEILAYPGSCYLKLTEDTLARFNLSSHSLLKVGFGHTKFYQKVNHHNQTVPIAQIVFLQKSTVTLWQKKQLQGYARLQPLLNSIYPELLARALLDEGWLMQQCSHIAQQIPIWLVSHPYQRFSAFEIAQSLLDSS